MKYVVGGRRKTDHLLLFGGRRQDGGAPQSLHGRYEVSWPPPLLLVGRAWLREAARGTAQAQARAAHVKAQPEPARTPQVLQGGHRGGGPGARGEGGPRGPRAHFPRSSNTRAVVSLPICTYSVSIYRLASSMLSVVPKPIAYTVKPMLWICLCA